MKGQKWQIKETIAHLRSTDLLPEPQQCVVTKLGSYFSLHVVFPHRFKHAVYKQIGKAEAEDTIAVAK